MAVHSLILVLGDQLTRGTAFDDAEPGADVVVMAEVGPAVQRRPNHRQRLVLFASAARHFRDALRADGYDVRYQTLGDDGPDDYPAVLEARIAELEPERVVCTAPSRHGLREALHEVAATAGVAFEGRPDPHFLRTVDAFAAWAEGRKRLTMEYFYREVRRDDGYLMDGDEPAGGTWNLDEDNREAFSVDGPGSIKAPVRFQPDDLTRKVIGEVEALGGELYGPAQPFHWPVTHEEALRAARDFVEHRLPHFGTYQDAMWSDRPFLYHSALSAALNLRLLDPRPLLEKAEAAYRHGHAPLNAVEGFVRQVAGWREYVRGVYHTQMPGYTASNALDARRELPALFWTGETGMACLHQCVGQVLEHGYAHHIQRLMVMGLFGLLYGVKPQAMNDWHLALYVDAWAWVSAPNMVGMSQYADGGLVGTKPYAASGKYVDRMSDYCGACRFDPGAAVGENACPFTTLYWDFLARHEERLDGNRRMNFQLANLRRKSQDEREAIAERAQYVRRKVRDGEL